MDRKFILINIALAVPTLVFLIVGVVLLAKAAKKRKSEKDQALKMYGIATLSLDCACLIIIIGSFTRRIVSIGISTLNIILMLIAFIILLLFGILAILKSKQIIKIEAAERERLKREKKEQKKSKTRKRREQYHERQKEKSCKEIENEHESKK